MKCFECGNQVFKDGYCKSHWDFLFAGMGNKQRAEERKKLREMRAARKT